MIQKFLKEKLPGILSVGVFGYMLAAGVLDFNPLGVESPPPPPLEDSLARVTVGRWVPYNKLEYASARNQKMPVALVFTAAWCKYCKTDKSVVHGDRVLRFLEDNGVAAFIVDLTEWGGDNAQIAKALKVSKLPTYVVLLPNGEIVRHEGSVKRSIKRFIERIRDKT